MAAVLWAVLSACSLALAAAASTSTNTSAHDEAVCHKTHHSWFEHSYEYFHLEDYILAILVCLTAIFEYLWHTLQHKVGHGGDEHGEHGEGAEAAAQRVFKKDNQPFPMTLVQRTSQELMILGFLGFLVWVTLRLGAFEQVACAFSDWEGIALPDTSHGFQETVEDVHMHLFLSMVAFIALVGIGVAFTKKRQEEWRVANAVLCEAALRKTSLKHIIHLGVDEQRVTKALSNWNAGGEELAKLCPEGMSLFWFLRFARSRALFFARLRGLIMGDRADNPEVQTFVDIVEDLVQEAHPDAVFARSRIVDYLQCWFPFDHHLRLELHYQLTDLATIKIMTLLFLAFGLIIAAILINFTLNVVGHFLVIGIQLVVTFIIGISLPWVLKKKRSEQDVADEHVLGAPTEDDHSPTKIAEAQALVIGRCLGMQEPEDVPSLSMQLCLFTFCYNVIRLIATPVWWYEYQVFPFLAAVVGVIGLPLLGYFLSVGACALALFVGRGDLHLRSRHLSWCYVASSQRLYRVRRKQLKENRTKSGRNLNAAQDGPGTGTSGTIGGTQELDNQHH